ncbi:MAG: helix-turn-helix domain-containing protein [Streptosporangiaceae bacterium]|nr:helix-turn-helix domain-containing protein [Streptosporangiaceae bacterium]MBV9854715.1 helix-turn-helix domain-containing protein [Streptosporangiaceae bacterium]
MPSPGGMGGNGHRWPGPGATAAPDGGARNGYDGRGGNDRSRSGGIVIRQRDTAIPEPPPGGAIAAIESDNLASFARDLRVLRSQADLDYPEMAERSHYTMRTLASAAGGLRLPTLPVTVAFVRACGGNVAEWEERWGRLVKNSKNGRAALPAAGSASSGDPEVGPAAEPGTLPRPPQPDPGADEVYVITSAKPRDPHDPGDQGQRW